MCNQNVSIIPDTESFASLFFMLFPLRPSCQIGTDKAYHQHARYSTFVLSINNSSKQCPSIYPAQLVGGRWPPSPQCIGAALPRCTSRRRRLVKPPFTQYISQQNLDSFCSIVCVFFASSLVKISLFFGLPPDACPSSSQAIVIKSAVPVTLWNIKGPLSERRIALIPCTSECVYQSDGLCTLDSAAAAGVPALGGACVHFIPAKRLESPHRYSERAEAANPGSSPALDGPESRSV